MRLPRLPVLSALLVLLLAVRRCTAAALLRGTGRGADGRLDGRDMLELIGRYQKSRTDPGLTGVRTPGESRSQQGAEGPPRDPRLKDRFIKHLTGPISIKPKCKKHFNRLYYNTRDCTIPAWFRGGLEHVPPDFTREVRYTLDRRTSVNPIPGNLRSEAKKAAKILREFTEITNRNGPDKLIPAHVIAKAEGLAIISVIKAGFMITARGGSGIVIARLGDRRWSAPSAIGIAGLGGGFEIGVEVSDLVIILNQRRAIEAFTKGGNLTLGGNCTVAVGPMGRNVEADIALRSTAAVFTYCRSKGLFAGISLEGSYLIERKETNRKFYGQEIRASAILNGDVEPPTDCYDLYHILDIYTDAYTSDWTRKNLPAKSSLPPVRPPAPSQRKAETSSEQPTTSTGACSRTKNTLYPSVSIYKSETSGQFASRSSQTYVEGPSVGGASGQLVVTATHPFTGQQPGDLSFVPGDRITVLTKSDSQYDWWEGKLADGRVGIFPANFVTY